MNDLKHCPRIIREAVKKDPFFIAEILYPNLKFKKFHEQWFYQGLLNKDELVLGPRGFAKTTVRAVIRTIYILSQNPNAQLGIVSDTSDQAVKFMSEVKKQLETNEFIKLLYPHLAPGELWTNKEINIKGRTIISKNASVTALGYGQGTGSHFNDILIDDLVDYTNVKTKHRRDDLENWVNTSIMPMLLPGGHVHYNGSRYHDNELYGRLLKKGIHNNISQNTHKALQDDGTSLWEERWSKEFLVKQKQDLGSVAFNSQYQNDTTLMLQGSIFRREWFRYFSKEDNYLIREDGRRISRSDLQCYQISDLAISKKETADYFVILTFGVDREGNFYILNLLRGRYSWQEQKELTPKNYFLNLPLNWLAIESTQYQVVLAEELNSIPNMSIRKLNPQADKVTRANSMSAKFETGKVFIWDKLPHKDDFEDELCVFPEGEHDDMVDTVGYIPQCIKRDRPKISINV